MQEYNIKQIKECLELLRMAGLILPVIHSSANGIPLGAEINEKHTKYLFLDTGLYQNLLGLDLSDLLLSDNFSVINKGCIRVYPLYAIYCILSSLFRKRK